MLVPCCRCDCLSGYSGVSCEVNIDECASSPCNSGTCVDGVNKYTCVCPTDGVLYDENCNHLPPCTSSPCVNNATCVNRASDQYVCECQPGYQGQQCQTDIDECELFNVVCQNGGRCQDLRNNFTCSCRAGFAGKFCEIDVNECEDNLCRNNSTCREGRGDYICVCRPGFVGRYCNDTPTNCGQEPCYNNATCITESSGGQSESANFSCLCRAGYRGRYCEVDVEECLLNPCQNNATCRSGENSYR